MIPKRRGSGRPRSGEGRNFYESRLHALLLEGLPAECVTGGRVDRHKIAQHVKYSQHTIGRWMVEDRLTPSAVRALMSIEGHSFKTDDFLPFVFG